MCCSIRYSSDIADSLKVLRRLRACGTSRFSLFTLGVQYAGRSAHACLEISQQAMEEEDEALLPEVLRASLAGDIYCFGNGVNETNMTS